MPWVLVWVLPGQIVAREFRDKTFNSTAEHFLCPLEGRAGCQVQSEENLCSFLQKMFPKHLTLTELLQCCFSLSHHTELVTRHLPPSSS